jgi:photosystem II stability/assembly factor-like uncharacterized protein
MGAQVKAGPAKAAPQGSRLKLVGTIPGPEGDSALSVDFADSKYGWALNGTELWLTTDGGVTWKRGVLPKMEDDSEVADWRPLTGARGWVSWGHAGEHLAFTEDAGRSWREWALPPLNWSENVVGGVWLLPDGKTGWVKIGAMFNTHLEDTQVLLGESIYRTDDAGKRWRKQWSGPRGDVFLTQPNPSLRFFDALHGFAYTQNDYLCTSDGGRTWTRARFRDAPTGDEGNYDQMYSIFFLNAKTGWMFGEGGEIWRTSVGCGTWEMQRHPDHVRNASDGCSIAFNSPEHGWVVECDRREPDFKNRDLYSSAGGPEIGGLYETNDGGRTWSRAEPQRKFSRVDCVPSGGCWAVEVGSRKLYRLVGK